MWLSGNGIIFLLILLLTYLCSMADVIHGQDVGSGDSSCIQEGSGQICSGRGDCYHGICVCRARRRYSSRRYSGRYCQCDDYSCPYYLGHQCGGPERGRCTCGYCTCEQGWTGEACNCATSIASCMVQKANGSSVLCDGKGRCVCGTCQCEQDWFGPTCQDCPTCPGVCQQFKSCIQCRVFRTGPYSSDREFCYQNCSDKRIFYIERVNESSSLKKCEFRDEDNCIVHSEYEYGYDGQVNMMVQTLKECPPPT